MYKALYHERSIRYRFGFFFLNVVKIMFINVSFFLCCNKPLVSVAPGGFGSPHQDSSSCNLRLNIRSLNKIWLSLINNSHSFNTQLCPKLAFGSVALCHIVATDSIYVIAEIYVEWKCCWYGGILYEPLKGFFWNFFWTCHMWICCLVTTINKHEWILVIWSHFFTIS